MIFKGRIRKMTRLEEERGETSGQKTYLESILSSMTDSLIVINPDGTLRSVNQAALDLLEYREDELIGQPVKKIFPRKEIRRLNKEFQEILATGVSYNFGLTFLTKQGKMIPVNISGAAIRHGGEILGVVGVARDMRQIMAVISELEKKKAELEERSRDLTRTERAMLHMMGDLDSAKKETDEANRELLELSRLKSDFVSTVSHELRTPLTVTREAISQVLDGVYGEINKEQRKFLSMSIGGIDRLSRLIGNLLDISKIEAHKIELKREWIGIVSLAEEVCSSFASAFHGKGLETKCSFPKEEIELYLDKDRIIQVFVNLMSNALKFTSAGSVEISIDDGEEGVVCAVSDTGIGISDEDLPKVFSRFEQFGREFESAGKGTGLGLAISRGIIELHRGKIRAESRLGAGTKISFTLPKYSAAALIKEYANDALAEAMRKNASLSIIVCEVKNHDALLDKFGRDKISFLMRQSEQLIKKDLRGKSDIAVLDKRAIVTVLPETDKQGAVSTAERIKSRFDDYLSQEGLAQEIKLDLRVIGFPEDARTAEELLSKIVLPENIEK